MVLEFCHSLNFFFFLLLFFLVHWWKHQAFVCECVCVAIFHSGWNGCAGRIHEVYLLIGMTSGAKGTSVISTPAVILCMTKTSTRISLTTSNRIRTVDRQTRINRRWAFTPHIHTKLMRHRILFLLDRKYYFPFVTRSPARPVEQIRMYLFFLSVFLVNEMK